METHSTRVSEVMTSPAVTIRGDASSAEIIETLVRNDVRGLPVVDDAGLLLGIVTESDLVLSAAYGKEGRSALALVGEIIQGHPAGWVDRVNAQTAASLMTADVTTVGPDDTVAEASRRLLRRRCAQLPVVDAGTLVGIVSRHDVVRSLSGSPAPKVPKAAPVSEHELSEPQCLELLRNHDLGRLAYVRDDLPVIVPVNYAFDRGLIVFRTDPGEKLDEVPMHRVAFEIDGITADGAWSVLARGHAREVTTALGREYAELRAISIERRAPGDKDHWIAIEITRLTGRQFR